MCDEMIARRAEQELCSLFGEKICQLRLRNCTGKYRGHTDYTLVFGSGRQLYIGLDKRNYLNSLQDHLRDIRHFRSYQEENTRRINEILERHDTPYCHAAAEVVPYDSSNHLTIYGAVILTMECGRQLVYRTTNMHGFLVGWGKAPGFDFDSCMEHLLKDSCGQMTYTHFLSDIMVA